MQGKVVRTVQRLAGWLGMGRQLQAVAEAPTLQAQRAAWNRWGRGQPLTGCLHSDLAAGP